MGTILLIAALAITGVFTAILAIWVYNLYEEKKYINKEYSKIGKKYDKKVIDYNKLDDKFMILSNCNRSQIKENARLFVENEELSKTEHNMQTNRNYYKNDRNEKVEQLEEADILIDALLTSVKPKYLELSEQLVNNYREGKSTEQN